jgi:hypothetical protein
MTLRVCLPASIPLPQSKDLIPKEAGTIGHLRILPGLFDDYEALVLRVRRLDDLKPGSPRA